MSDEIAVPPPTTPTSGNPASSRDELGMTASAKTSWLTVNAAAKGFYAGFLLAALALAGELIFFHDLSSHQLLTVITAVVGGWFLGVGTLNARLADARDHIELCEREIERQSASTKRLEEQLLRRDRLSSAGSTPPTAPAGKKKR
jgi:hypothetical protein